MTAFRLKRNRDLFAWIVALSFVPFAVKAVDYLLIGSLVPLLVLVLLAVLVAVGWRFGGAAQRRALRTWAVAMVLWALARLGLLAMFELTGITEAAIEASFGTGYVLVSLAFLALGVTFYRAAPAPSAR